MKIILIGIAAISTAYAGGLDDFLGNAAATPRTGWQQLNDDYEQQRIEREQRRIEEENERRQLDEFIARF